jgi:hypothetical protein
MKKQPDTTTLVAFPEDALVGSLGDLAKVLSEGTEVPKEFYFACGLTIVGAIASKRLKLDVSFEPEPRLYTVLLGESYSVKKSTALKRTIAFFEQHVELPHVVYGLGSAEGLARVLGENGTVIAAYDELRALIDKCGVKGSTLLPMVTSLFEQTKWHNATKRACASETVDDGHLSLLACCTLDTYANIWRAEAIAIGLPNRLFVVNADQQRKVPWPAKPDAGRLKNIGSRLRQQIAKLPVQLEVTQPGKDEWASWYENVQSSEHARRLDTIGFRLLALIALTTDQDAVDAPTVRTVVSILNYELALRKLTDPIDADSTIAKMEESIRRYLKQKGPLDDRQLRQATHASRTGLWVFQRALANLRDVRDIENDGGKWRLTKIADAA